ncbi:MAG: hypothetical protein HYU55_12950 [Nocardioides sp.]|nr:hypothetical protein [Nocardioides sp.]
MEIVTGESAPTVERDEAVRLLREMAAVVRTLLGAPAPVAAVTRTDPPAPAPSPVPAAPVAPAPPPLAGLPVPSLPVPSPASLSADPEERRSLAALQEIAFLDE